MEKYNIELRLSAPRSSELIEESISQFCEDMGFTILKLNVIKRNRRGRPLKSDRKVQVWLDRRTKPFTVQVFADYLGVSRPAAWRRLENLVSQGVVAKRDTGSRAYEYEVHRITSH